MRRQSLSLQKQRSMTSSLFWFDDEQWAKIVPHLPMNQPGPERKDDRRILSGIMHVLKIGCRWQDCPKDYGPHKTIYNRFSRWSERGIWQRIFESVATPCEAPQQAALDASHIKVHRCANGGSSGDRGYERRPQQQDSCNRRRVLPAVGVHPYTGQHRRLRDGRGVRQPSA